MDTLVLIVNNHFTFYLTENFHWKSQEKKIKK